MHGVMLTGKFVLHLSILHVRSSPSSVKNIPCDFFNNHISMRGYKPPCVCLQVQQHATCRVWVYSYQTTNNKLSEVYTILSYPVEYYIILRSLSPSLIYFSSNNQ